jgi:DNA mismatch endonuclease, patch repair protein
MTDHLSAEERSNLMRKVRGKDTKPELIVRRLIHSMGFRYRLHVGNLPGHPDIVFTSKNRIVFVHGCFWHRHSANSCRFARLPKSREEFWVPKLEANRLRDARNQRALRRLGWKILVVWECQLGNKEQLKNKLSRYLED